MTKKIQHIEKIKEVYTKKALEQTSGQKSKAAKLLGLNSPNAFRSWIDKYIDKNV